MVRSFSSTAVSVEAVGWSGVRARAARGDAVAVLPSCGEVGPYGPTLVGFERCPTKLGSRCPGLGGDEEPGKECGKWKGTRFGGSWRILCEEFLVQPRLGKILGRRVVGAIVRRGTRS